VAAKKALVPPSDLINTVDAYVLACFEQESQPQVTELALSLGITRWKLSRQFQRRTGTSLRAHLKRRRLEQAEELLEKTTLPVAEVARRSGFGTDRSLERAFYRATGNTPASLRHKSK